MTVGNRDVCLYNDSNACSFGVTVGVIGFLMCLAFLVKDVLYVIIDFSNNLTVSPPIDMSHNVYDIDLQPLFGECLGLS